VSDEREEATLVEVIHRIREGTFYEDYDWASGPALRALERANARRLQLVKSTCEVRDTRWSIHIDAGDNPCSVRVKHRQYGDYYDWPETTFEGPNGTYGGICPAADRAYTMQEESYFRTRSAALKAGHDFLRRFGAGEVEYLEWDVDSQSMVVVGHAERRSTWWKHPDDMPDPLAPFYVNAPPQT